MSRRKVLFGADIASRSLPGNLPGSAVASHSNTSDHHCGSCRVNGYPAQELPLHSDPPGTSGDLVRLLIRGARCCVATAIPLPDCRAIRVIRCGPTDKNPWISRFPAYHLTYPWNLLVLTANSDYYNALQPTTTYYNPLQPTAGCRHYDHHYHLLLPWPTACTQLLRAAPRRLVGPACRPGRMSSRLTRRGATRPSNASRGTSAVRHTWPRMAPSSPGRMASSL
jgi:hypothetical protein